VFVIAIFDPVLANRCPNPLLPVAESLPRHLAKGKSKRKSAATTPTESTGTDGQWWDGRDTAEALTTTSNEQRMPDKQRFQAIVEQEVVGTLTVSDLVKGVNNEIIGKGLLQVVEDRQPYTPSSFAQYKEEDMHAVATLRAGGGDLGGGSEVLIAEPYVKSSRAQTSDDSETWIPGEVNPTLNSFDVGDTRATTAIVEPAQMENRPVKEIVGSLQARVTATNHESIRDGHAIVEEMTLIDGQRVGDVRIYTEPVQTLGARMGTGGNNVPMLAFDTQFGSNANVTEDVAFTLKASQQSPSVAYAIQGNVVGRQDHNGPAGKGHTEEGDPMFTLTSTDVHAVAYDEYNDSTNEVHHALRAGTKQSTGVLLGSEVAATLRSGGDGGVPSSRGEHLVAEPTMAVRRLTPLECERLMGWPDDHTRWKADGTEAADSHRYRQCGNGVASPVAQWIAKHILNI
jgi:hypothetical protein